MNTIDIIDQVPELAKLIALYIKADLAPMEDLITSNRAYKDYGRSWVEGYTKRGVLQPKVHGKKRLYSRAEIERIVAKENEIARIKGRGL